MASTRRSATLVAGLLLGSLGATGCVQHFRPIQHTPDMTIGRTLAEVIRDPGGEYITVRDAPKYAGRTVYDLTPVLSDGDDLPPEMEGVVYGDLDEDWIVVADCTPPDAESLTIAVVHETKVTPEIMAKAGTGEYVKYMGNCGLR